MKKCKQDTYDGRNLIQMPTYDAQFGTTEHNVNVRTIHFHRDLEITDRFVLTTNNGMSMPLDKNDRHFWKGDNGTLERLEPKSQSP